MPDEVAKNGVPRKRGKSLIKDNSAENSALEEKLGFFDEIVSNAFKLEQVFFSVLKMLAIILLMLFIGILVPWITIDDSGFVVQPFETSGVGGSLDGYSIAHLLSSELQRIQNIDEKAADVVLFTGINYIGQGSERLEDITHRTYSARSIDGSAHQTQLISSLAEPKPISDYSIISLKGDSLKYTISGMGSLGIGGAQFSPGNLLLFLKEIMRRTPSPITGSIQRYNSSIIIVATLEDHKSDKLFTWEVRRKITGSDASQYEQIPSMIRDLSFQIAPDLGRLRQPEIYYPQSWQALKYQTDAQEAYISYNRTLNISYLDLARAQSRNPVIFLFSKFHGGINLKNSSSILRT